MDVIGALEYEPDVPANLRPRHREFLRDKASAQAGMLSAGGTLSRGRGLKQNSLLPPLRAVFKKLVPVSDRNEWDCDNFVFVKIQN